MTVPCFDHCTNLKPHLKGGNGRMNRNQTHQAEPFSSFMLEFSLRLCERATKEIYSSDFAMQFALAARGWHIEPWEETAQMEPRSSFSELFFLSVLFFSSLCVLLKFAALSKFFS